MSARPAHVTNVCVSPLSLRDCPSQTWYFDCQQWLAIDIGDCQIERVLKATLQVCGVVGGRMKGGRYTPGSG